MIDLISYLRRIQNKDVNETFNPATDSLEALRDWLATVLGVGPGVGLWMFGVCDPAMVASQTTIVTNNLAGLPNDVFNNEFWMQVIHNVNAPGAAPEREIRRITDFVGATQTFTVDDFSANVEANDLICIFHESILPTEILGFGTLTISSTTVPRDGARTEGDDYFNGCLLMTTEGAARFQPRRIVDYDGTGAPGTFTLDPNNPFSVAPGLVDYIIINAQTEFAPAADGANNRTPADVMGSKADTYIWSPTATASIMRYLKGLLDSSGLIYRATITDVPNATSFRAAELIGYGSTYFRNWTVYVVLDAAGLGAAPQDEYQTITAFNSADATFTHPAFTAQLAIGDKVLLLHPWLRMLATNEAAGPYSYLDAGGEQTVYEDATVIRRRISLDLDLNAMTQNGTVRLYRKVDGANYRIWIQEAFNVGGAEKVFSRGDIVTNQHFKVTYQEDVNEGAARSIPYNIIRQVME